MAETTAGIPPRYLRTQEAARFLGLSERTLEKHRTYGTGPAYRKLGGRSEEHTSELQSLMRISNAVFCLKKKNFCYYTFFGTCFTATTIYIITVIYLNFNE